LAAGVVFAFESLMFGFDLVLDRRPAHDMV
jgi:hypothetical protein